MQGCSSPWLQAVVWVAGNLRHGAPQAGGTMGHRLERRDRWTSMPSLIRLWPFSAAVAMRNCIIEGRGGDALRPSWKEYARQGRGKS